MDYINSSNFRCRSGLMIFMAKLYITLELKLSSSNGMDELCNVYRGVERRGGAEFGR